jgi:DNA-binding response OmpR family regulator
MTDLHLDAETHHLIGPLGSVHLTPVQSRIMQCLLDDPGGGNTILELAAVIWPDNPPAGVATTLRMHIHHLRLALHKVTARTVIAVSHPESVYALADADPN